MPVADFMAACLFDPRHGYYARGAGLGRDFTTAPEISQMFGELLGGWLAQEWGAIGAPSPCRLIELGPGRGVLMADAWRVLGRVPALEPWLVEASAPLREMQATRLAAAAPRFAARLEEVPAGPCLLLANEFLDCLPIRQFVRTGEGWRERLVGLAGDGETLAFGLAPAPLGQPGALPAALRNAPPGALVEICPAAPALLAGLAQRLLAHPGRALFLDYGPAESEPGDTLQALRAGEKLGPLAAPGESDLSARVDFAELKRAGTAFGLQVHGPLPQGLFLERLGLGARAAALAAANPHRAGEFEGQRRRLAAPEEMGALFQAICFSSPNLPTPAGFA